MLNFLGIGACGIGNRLMVGYHKSAITNTACTSGKRVPAYKDSIFCAYRCITAWRGWVADDLWYPTMRKSPTPSAP
jgi:hypothetical protein